MWKQHKKMITVGGVIVAILLIGGGAFLLLGKKTTAPSAATNIPQDQTQNIPTIAPSDIGMSLAVTRNGQSVTMTVTKLDGITALDYEVTYTAVNNGNSIPRGIIGHVDVKPGDSQEKQEVVLGTCSDVCHYDNGVTTVKFAVKVTKAGGQVSEVDQSIDVQ